MPNRGILAQGNHLLRFEQGVLRGNIRFAEDETIARTPGLAVRAVQLAQLLGDEPLGLLVRLTSNRCFYADPASGPKGGHPRWHNAKFDFRKSQTWWNPLYECLLDDVQYEQLHIQAWPEMHAKPDRHATRGTYQPHPLIPGTLIRITVSKLPKQAREPKPLWLWWHGPTLPDFE